MKDTDKITPEIRFPEFTDTWEQRKLGDIATFINGRAYSQNELLSSGKYKVLRVGNFYTNDSWYYSDLELDDKYYTEEGDLLYTWSATFGPHIWHGDKVIYHYHIWKVELSDQLEKTFAVQLLEQDKAALLSDKNGSTMVHITKAGMENKIVLIPSSVEEQVKIGACLNCIDNAITLHQRKCDELKIYKKGLLQQMFPQPGEAFPRVRFPSFTNPWEQRKLGDMATFSKGKGYSKSDLSEDGKPIILYGRLYTKYETVISEVDTFAEEKDGSVFSSGGEVIVPASGETAEEISIASVVANSGILLGGDLNIISPSEELDPAFLAINITYGNPHNEMAKLAQGKTVVHLHNEDLKKIDLLYPSLEEQKQISDVFKRIDKIITLHQRKCDELKLYKKGLLQKMFV